MKRIIPVLIIIAAFAAFWFRDAWLPESGGHKSYLGSVEAKMVLVGALAPGRLAEVKAVKGAKVSKGDPLFRLESDTIDAEVAQAKASVETAEASLADVEAGKRPEELAVFDREEEEANANLVLAQTNYRRIVQLNTTGVAAASQYDSAKAAVDSAQAKLQQIAANRQVAELPARDTATAVAQSRVAEARAALQNVLAQLADRSVAAPSDGVIDDVYFDAGEVVAQGQPVVSLLTRDALVLRFFVPETDLAKMAVGTKITFACDHCASGQTALVTRVFNQPEFTPPVIYSEATRAKLVFQVEARPEAGAVDLKPGQPISVEPLP